MLLINNDIVYHFKSEKGLPINVKNKTPKIFKLLEKNMAVVSKVACARLI